MFIVAMHGYIKGEKGLRTRFKRTKDDERKNRALC